MSKKQTTNTKIQKTNMNLEKDISQDDSLFDQDQHDIIADDPIQTSFLELRNQQQPQIQQKQKKHKKTFDEDENTKTNSKIKKKSDDDDEKDSLLASMLSIIERQSQQISKSKKKQKKNLEEDKNANITPKIEEKSDDDKNVGRVEELKNQKQPQISKNKKKHNNNLDEQKNANTTSKIKKKNDNDDKYVSGEDDSFDQLILNKKNQQQSQISKSNKKKIDECKNANITSKIKKKNFNDDKYVSEEDDSFDQLILDIKNQQQSQISKRSKKKIDECENANITSKIKKKNFNDDKYVSEEDDSFDQLILDIKNQQQSQISKSNKKKIDECENANITSKIKNKNDHDKHFGRVDDLNSEQQLQISKIIKKQKKNLDDDENTNTTTSKNKKKHKNAQVPSSSKVFSKSICYQQSQLLSKISNEFLDLQNKTTVHITQMCSTLLQAKDILDKINESNDDEQQKIDEINSFMEKIQAVKLHEQISKFNIQSVQFLNQNFQLQSVIEKYCVDQK